MDDEGLSFEGLRKIIDSAIDPEASFRRSFCRRLASQVHTQFGQEGLLDLLTGIDLSGKFVSVIVLDKSEVENYLFTEHGVYDEGIFERVQMTDEWDEFLANTLDRAGAVIGELLDRMVTKD